MKSTNSDLCQRLAYILHSGLIELRNLSLGDNRQQIHDLADALEILPRYLHSSTEEDERLIEEVLQTYQRKYPQSAFNYVGFLQSAQVPGRF